MALVFLRVKLTILRVIEGITQSANVERYLNGSRVGQRSGAKYREQNVGDSFQSVLDVPFAANNGGYGQLLKIERGVPQEDWKRFVATIELAFTSVSRGKGGKKLPSKEEDGSRRKAEIRADVHGSPWISRLGDRGFFQRNRDKLDAWRGCHASREKFLD